MVDITTICTRVFASINLMTRFKRFLEMMEFVLIDPIQWLRFVYVRGVWWRAATRAAINRPLECAFQQANWWLHDICEILLGHNNVRFSFLLPTLYYIHAKFSVYRLIESWFWCQTIFYRATNRRFCFPPLSQGPSALSLSLSPCFVRPSSRYRI